MNHMCSTHELILATDLDGTFLPPEGGGGASELYKLIRNNSEKILLIFVTGRAYESILSLLDDPLIPAPDYIIADVGGTILKRQGDTYAPVMPLQQEIAEKWPGHDVIWNRVASIGGLQRQEVPQERRCSFYYEDPSILPAVHEVARSIGLDVLTSAGKYLDFLPLGVSKGDSLRRLLEVEDLSPDKVLVAGDTLNDLSLMKTGYKGVIVSNAETALTQAVVSHQAPLPVFRASQPGPGGILEAIRHHGFTLKTAPPLEGNPRAEGAAELVIVYHRQPFDEVRQDGGQVLRRLPRSPNGILPTLLGFFAEGKKGAWVAWSQQDSRTPEDFEVDVYVDVLKYPHLVASRVALTEEDINIFYKQFSKEAFWPIIFSFPERASFIEAHWVRFCEVNRLFAERTAAVAAEGATVWIHDYNLWMMPAYLRELRPDLKIAFFHHTAFPSADIFNILPWKGQIVSSLLKCDYVGFHIPRYVENFIDVVRSNVPTQILERECCAPTYLSYGCALGVEEITRAIQTPQGVLRVGAHPVGIDNEKVRKIVKSTESQALVGNLLAETKGRRVILSVERLDYVKGPIEKMLAFEKLLDMHPQWHGKVVMLNIVTPAAPGMEIYEKTREQLDQVVGRINGRFSSMDWTPVRYFYRSFPFEELVSFYVAADVAWITPLRDGLNLVCKEYISAKSASDTLGVLVLSEFAGAAVELKGAVLTNPYDEASMIQSLHNALSLDGQEAAFRMQALAQRVLDYDVNVWGSDFLNLRHPDG